jgi:hypothetical protein
MRGNDGKTADMSGIGEPYQCARCLKWCVKSRSDEEAMEESLSMFPVDQLFDEPAALVCESCFQKAIAWAKENAPEFLL